MTAQICDLIDIEGSEAELACELPLPFGHSRLLTLSDAEAQQLCPFAFSTMCWRNYFAAWSIRNGRLFLQRIDGKYALSGVGPLFAEWVSETLRVVGGDVVRHRHAGYGARWATELEIVVCHGAVRQTRPISPDRTMMRAG